MPPRSVICLTLALASAAPQAQPLGQPAGTVAPSAGRAVIGPALPAPPMPSAGPPSAFLTAGRRALDAGHPGEAREALERAETRLLDRAVQPAAAFAPDNGQAVLAIAAARRALAVHDRAAAILAIDDALAAVNQQGTRSGVPADPARVTPPPPPSRPVVTRTLLPGHWTLHGARSVWVPPETTPRVVRFTPLVPGTYVWRNGAYVWVPAHFADP